MPGSNRGFKITGIIWVILAIILILLILNGCVTAKIQYSSINPDTKQPYSVTAEYQRMIFSQEIQGFEAIAADGSKIKFKGQSSDSDQFSEMMGTMVKALSK